MPIMLTHAECIAKAADMELQAIVYPEARDEYLELAAQWRGVAARAKWQERYEGRSS
jgi:hypothetical protein